MTTNLMAPVCPSSSTMTRHTAALAMLMASGLCALGAQNAPPPVANAPAANVLAPPPTAPPPPAPAPARPARSAERLAPTPAVLMPLKRESASPDSMVPALVASRFAPPANAVALCSDGTFIVAPNDPAGCTPRGGVRALFPTRIVPKPPAPTAEMTRRSAVSVRTAAAAPPAGTTMQCKDGTYLGGRAFEDRCSGNGGVAVVFPAAPTPPPPPARRP